MTDNNLTLEELNQLPPKGKIGKSKDNCYWESLR